MPNETTLAWTRDSRKLVVLIGHRLVSVDRITRQTTSVPAPNNVPARWTHVMTATVSRGRITLADTVTGLRFQSAG
jgi:hypothetical protein